MKRVKFFLVIMMVAIIAAFGITCFYNGNKETKIVEATLI